jgi:hypothetical protein
VVRVVSEQLGVITASYSVVAVAVVYSIAVDLLPAE